MAGTQLTYKLDGIDQALAAINALPDQIPDLYEGIGGLLESQTRRRLSEEKTSPDGVAWPEWTAAYADSRHKGQRLLVGEGDLLDSIAWDLAGDDLEWGSNLEYAAIHQHGGTSSMKPGPAAIPAREFLGLSTANEQEITDFVNRSMAEGLA
jgi:phage virion morphogenesis protein